MVDTIKFSEMTDGGDLENGEKTPGLSGGANVLFNNPWTFLASGTTGERPVPAASMYYRLRFNTTLEVYEYYDPTIPLWTQLSGTGTGTVNPGVANDIAYYAASGQSVSPINGAANSVLVTNASEVPSLSTTLPSGITIPTATITTSTATLTAGSITAAPVAGDDIVNKTYADGLFASGVTSLTGTTNQISFSSPTGAVTASLPQDIATGSTPTFAGMTLSSIPLSSSSGGTGINNGTSTLTLGGNLETSGAFNSVFTMTGATNVTFPTSGTLSTTTGTVTSVSGTANQIDVGGTAADPVLSLSATLDAPGTFTIQNTVDLDAIIDDDTMATATATNVPTSESVKSYVDGLAPSPLPSVGAAGTVIRSSGAAWAASTATFADTYSASTLLYSNGANTVQGLATTNNAALGTNASGVPTWNALTDGQMLIGSTSGAPIAANLTEDGGTVITNAANSVTISTASNVAKNLIIGGNFDTNPWQRGTTFTSVASAAYTADRFRVGYSSTAVADVTKAADAPTVAEAGIFSSNCLKHEITTADASIGAGDFYYINQWIEGYNYAQIAQRSFTVSFWVKATVTGIYCVSFLNSGSDRSYIAEYTVNTTATWEYKTITVSASPSAGTWDYTNGKGIGIFFMLAAGSTYYNTPDTWLSVQDFATSNQVNALGTIGNVFQLALIQIEGGTVATPFEIQTRQEVLTSCQRYFEKTFQQGTAPAQAVGSYSGCMRYISQTGGVKTWGLFWPYEVQKRVAGTITYYNPVNANANFFNLSTALDSGAAATSLSSANGVLILNPQIAGDGAGSTIQIHATSSAEL